jgi:hypothetical protein
MVCSAGIEMLTNRHVPEGELEKKENMKLSNSEDVVT